MYFGNCLRLFMIRKKIKVTELAEKAGISQSALSNILQSKRGIKKETFEKIIKCLELTEKEQFDLKRAYSLEKMDNDIANYFLELEEENKKAKSVLEVLEILKK